MKEFKKSNKKLLPVYGEFKDKVEALFDSCKKYLHGEYQLNTIYKNMDTNPNICYGLVYADYFEKDVYSEKNFLNTYKKDAILLHKKLIESKISLDYYHIMPYYTKLDGNCTFYNGDIIITNELKIE